MTSDVGQITFDCRDPSLLASFWREALGYVDDPANPNVPGDPEAYVVDPRGLRPALLFIPVPEGKAVKNRVHLDVVPRGPQDAEVARLLALGATLVEDRRTPDGGWVVLADPEGNELCVERSRAERGAPGPVDTGERDFPPTRTGDERAQLASLLDWYRDGVVAKVRDLSDRVATTRPLPSATSIAGLVKHLALVEDSWFAVRFAGLPAADWYADVDWDADRDWEFTTAVDEPLAVQVERYEAACERSRRAAGDLPLDAPAAADEGKPFLLRFAYVHLLEETARHLGHLDVLAELLAGRTGE